MADALDTSDRGFTSTQPSLGSHRFIEPESRPYAGTPLSTDRKGYQTARTQCAANDLWPHGRPPAGMSVADRNKAVVGWFAAEGLNAPSERQLRRIFGGG
jgi:hypothetical protein